MAQRMYASCGAAVGLRMTAVLNRRAAVAVVLVSLLIEWLKSSRSQTGSRPDRGVSMYFSSCVFFSILLKQTANMPFFLKSL